MYANLSLSKLQSLYESARRDGDHDEAEVIGSEIDAIQRHWSYDI